MSRSWCLCLAAVVACASAGSGGDAPSDARAGVDAGCALQTYYLDSDGDGHGDPGRPIEACEPPAGAVALGDDCDDSRAQRAPGLPELCDGLDNDCNAVTTELCPAGCTPMRRPAPDDQLHVYLLCGTPTSWATARSTCAGAMYRLVQIDDAAENAFIRQMVTAAYGTVDIHIGGTDSVTESTWVWDGGDPFWQGGPGGTALGGRYTNWGSGEPNDDGTEDCAEMRANGTWNDDSCGSSQRFVCRR